LEMFCPTRIASFGSIVLRRCRAWDKGIPCVSRISFDNLHHRHQSNTRDTIRVWDHACQRTQ
jgi:hypothetical protein